MATGGAKAEQAPSSRLAAAARPSEWGARLMRHPRWHRGDGRSASTIASAYITSRSDQRSSASLPSLSCGATCWMTSWPTCMCTPRPAMHTARRCSSSSASSTPKWRHSTASSASCIGLMPWAISSSHSPVGSSISRKCSFMHSRAVSPCFSGSSSPAYSPASACARLSRRRCSGRCRPAASRAARRTPPGTARPCRRSSS